MKKSTKYVIGILIAVVLGIIIFKASRGSAGPGIYDEFAQCLTDSGAKMYGAYWCPHCANQKKMFGSSVKYIPYVECDVNGDNSQMELCEANGVQRYPTWVFADGTRKEGEIPLRTLASITNCSLPEDAN